MEKVPGLLGILRTGRDWLVNLLLRDERELVIQIRGIRLSLPANRTSVDLYIMRPYEPTTTTLFEAACRDACTVLDVGACFGLYCLLASRRVGRSGRVVAVEPDPQNYRFLVKNIDLNNLNGVVIPVQVAIGRLDEQRAWLYSYSSPGYSSLYLDPLETPKRRVEVNCSTVDEVVETWLEGRVDVIKMDIEGCELFALEGMERTIKRNPSLKLFLEWNPARLGDAGVDAGEVIALLKNLGFQINLIDENSRCIRPFADSDLQKAYPRGTFFNLLCER